jgi:predicted dienelactone hydrolase
MPVHTAVALWAIPFTATSRARDAVVALNWHLPHLLAPAAPLVLVPAGQGSHVADCAAWAMVSTGQGVQVTFRPPGDDKPGLQHFM